MVMDMGTGGWEASDAEGVCGDLMLDSILLLSGLVLVLQSPRCANRRMYGNRIQLRVISPLKGKERF
jgi:streptomycin 6-kinase